jgi:Zn-dependent peptidase ImmA (M78 family)/O-acetyl-ADP-ribose deacetylase (regulator of RNase III)
MKHSEKNKSKSSGQESSLMETLLGPDDDLAADECSEEFLEALDIDPAALTAEFISRLEKESLEFSESVERPRTRAALRSIRAQMDTAKNVETSKFDAKRMLLTDAKSGYWTNRSVVTLASGGPPVERITQQARKVILEFTEAGNPVLPLDPFALAEFRKIKVLPREDIRDARTRFIDGRFVIEFNPNRPRGRVRYSICHEITHTFFPDCSEAIRNRSTHEEMESDEWQLEMLCNIGAGELLMPFVTLPDFDEGALSIQKLMEMRKDYDVSTEALLLRIARITSAQCCVFSASRKGTSEGFQIDYSRPSRSWKVPLQSGLKIPKSSVVRHCTAIGYSETGIEQWLTSLGDLKVECVGVPPYPDQIHPRVMGFIAPAQASGEEGNRIQYKGGDATDPRQTHGYRIIAHLVNDRTPVWGGAFARAVKKKWSEAQIDFEQWAASNRGNLALGKLRVVEVMNNLAVATMVAQHGYGESAKPRIRYGALKAALDELAEFAAHHDASVHMPKIGSGQAGGNWGIISELIEDSLCDRGIQVFVYTPSDARTPRHPQGRLTFQNERLE